MGKVEMLFNSWLSALPNRVRSGKQLTARRQPRQTRPTILEQLETRQLLTAPNFVSVSPNIGDFLEDGDVLQESPQELVFQFSPGQVLDSATLDAVQVIGGGHDEGFTPAHAVTDLGTSNGVLLDLGTRRLGAAENGATLTVLAQNNGGNGPTAVADSAGNVTVTLDNNAGTPTAQQLIDFIEDPDSDAHQLLTVTLVAGDPGSLLDALPVTPLILQDSGAAWALDDLGVADLNIQFTSTTPGLSGNDTSVQINRLDLGTASSTPQIIVVGQRVLLTVNENPMAATTAQELINTINGHSSASRLVNAALVTGSGSATLDQVADGTLLRLRGADRPLYASTTFGFQSTSVERSLLQFTALAQGRRGNEVELVFNRANLSASNAAPTISVSASGSIFTITLNTNTNAPTTVTALLSALTGHAQASAMFSARQILGLPTTNLAATISNGTRIKLSGADPSVVPGFRGLLPSNREVVYRFAAPPGNDLYHVQVIGSGASPLTNVTNEPLNDGVDTFLDVALDLGAVATSVVPQPVLRERLVNVLDVSRIADGDTLTVDPGNGTSLFTFEFNSGVSGDTRSGDADFEILLTGGMTNADVAAAIRDAINTAAGLEPDLAVSAELSGASSVAVTGYALDVQLTIRQQNATALTQSSGGLVQRDQVVNVYFNKDELDAVTAEDPRFYRLSNTQSTAATDDDTVLIPESIIYNAELHLATLTFASSLPTASWHLQIGSSQEGDGIAADAVELGTIFNGSGFATTALIGDDGTAGADVDLYRFTIDNGGNLMVDVLPDAGLDTTIRLLQNDGMTEITAGVTLPTGGTGSMDLLVATGLSSGTYLVEISSNSGTGSYRVGINTTAASPLTTDDNSSFNTATALGTLGAAGFNLSAQIEPQSFVAIPSPPGTDDEPGHRSNPVEGHERGNLGDPANPSAIPNINYHFPDVYGFDPAGNELHNQITEGQKDLARFIFEMFSRYTGVQFTETAGAGFPISTGDIRAADPTLPVTEVAGISTVIINAASGGQGNDNTYDGPWMSTALHEIGHAIGLGHSSDLPTFMDGNGGSPFVETPASAWDLLHLENRYPRQSTDIDLYQFEVEQAGYFTASVTARQSVPASALDASLMLFRDPFATAESDFQTGDLSGIRVTAASPGVFGNGIRLTFVKSDFGNAGAPLLTFSGHDVTVTLNTNAGNESTAQDVVDAINGSLQALPLFRAELTGSDGVITGFSGSTLDVVLNGGNRRVVARNDAYFGDDPFIGIDLQPGTYYIGVSARGNTSYDPTISDTGFGGQSNGAYGLSIQLDPAEPTSSIVDVDVPANPGTLFDGDSDREQGGTFDFWFETGQTVFVDKTTTTPVVQQDGTLDRPYNTISAALSRSRGRIVVPEGGAADIADGEFFRLNDGSNLTVVFEFDTDASVIGNNIAIDLSGAVTAADVATAIAAAINGQQMIGNLLTVATPDTVNGLVDITNVSVLDASDAASLLKSPNLLRIVGNGGADGLLTTPSDATPYTIGINNVGATLPDGRDFEVPQGVTVMIDAGAVLKLQSAGIDVGSPSATVNRQNGAVQLLGTPFSNVFMTSFRDDTLGGNSDGASAGPVPGHWEGVVFRADSDMNLLGTPDLDTEIYLNSVRHATISYAGGQNVSNQVFDPIYILGQRPTVAFSTITNSASHAIAATPNSFNDANGRSGPDIHDNLLDRNSVNGLFVLIQTSLSEPLEQLDVNARFTQIDMPFVLLENLLITGNAGGLLQTNEVQEISALGTPTNGTFTLSFTGGAATASTTLTAAIGTSTLNTGGGDITAVQTTITVADASGFGAVDASPSSIDFLIRIGNEELQVTNIVGNNLTVIRGANGTTADIHPDGTAVEQISVRVGNSSIFPADDDDDATIDFNLTINGEDIAVRDVTGTTLIFDRGVNGTTPGNHTAGSTVRRARTTVELPFSSDAATVQAALEALDGIGPGGVTLTGGPLPQSAMRVEFTFQTGSADQNLITVNNSLLTNGSLFVEEIETGGQLVSRAGGRLQIDPGVIVKLGNSRIEGLRGSSNLIAEGLDGLPVVFTSVKDDRYGSGGTFDTANDGYLTVSTNTPDFGDWGGLEFQLNSSLSLDQAYIAFAGGETAVEGGSGSFNAVELHEANGRIANTTFESNDNGTSNGGPDGKRSDRESNSAAVIFVRGAQPVIVNNVFLDNRGSTISIDANSLKTVLVEDPGRATGANDSFNEFDNNSGPLVRLNRLSNDASVTGGTLGMSIRGESLDSETVWDDTDIVHVLRGTIRNDYFHSLGGLTLQSASNASLVVKMDTGAGFEIGTSNAQLLDIVDRIGGSMQVIGAPGFPVIITSLKDDSVGASLDPFGFPHTDTNGNSSANAPAPGDWDHILFDKYANDTNMAVIVELENGANTLDLNRTPSSAQVLGDLAPNLKSANEIRRGGFEVLGTISEAAPSDVDVYKFTADPGTEVWLDIDKSDPSLDSIIELIDSNGNVLARSQDDAAFFSFGVTANVLEKSSFLGGDYYATTVRDAGMRVSLPAGGTYFVRVRSNPAAGNIADLEGGLTSGRYQLQVRLQQRDQQPGVAVTQADIRYATDGIIVSGLPYHSPLTAEAAETGIDNQGRNGGQLLGNLLASDRGSVGFGGTLSSFSDIDFYRFDLDIQDIQVISGASDGGKNMSFVIDLDWADGLTRADTSVALFDSSGALIYFGRASNIADDQPAPGQGNDTDDLNRGSVGTLDPYIGPIELPATAASYFIAIVNNQQVPNALSASLIGGTTNTSVRLEPVNSIRRIAEDHIGFVGYDSNGAPIDPVGSFFNGNGDSPLNTPTPDPAVPLIDVSSAESLATSIAPMRLEDLALFLSGTNDLQTNNPQNGALATIISNNLNLGQDTVQDVVMRSDGIYFAYRRDFNTNTNTNNGHAGILSIYDTGTGARTDVGDDGILAGTPINGADPGDVNFEQVTNTDDVDALTFRRTGVNNGLPVYNLLYSVRESGVFANGTASFNSKLYQANPATGSAAVVSGQPFGNKGDIQLSGTNPASATQTFFDSSPTNGTIAIQSRAQGTAANGVTLIVTSVLNASLQVTTVGSTVTVRTGFTVSGGNTTFTHTLQNVADAINTDGNAQRVMTASIGSGNGGVRVSGGATIVMAGGTDDPSGQRIQGNVTGFAFDQYTNGTFYGVTGGEGTTTAGSQLISINQNNGTATIIRDFTSLGIGTTASNGFSGLTRGPENLAIVVGTLATDINETDTTFDLLTLNPLPAGTFQLLIGTEYMTATAVDSDTVTVTRTNSVATSHSAGDRTSVPGYLRNTLIASTQDGRMVAFDPATGTGRIVFDSNSAVQSLSVQGEQTTLSGLLLATTTIIDVTDASVFGSATPFEIQIGSERMRVTSVDTINDQLTVVRGLTDTPRDTLGAAVNASSGTLIVPTGAIFTTATPFQIRVDSELMTVTNVGGGTLSVQRGQGGTTPVAHVNGAAIYETSATTHADGDSIHDLSSTFTITYDSGASLLTTSPLAINAAGAVSRDEAQTFDAVAYAGTYTLSFVNNLAATSGLAADIPASTAGTAGEVITVQNGSVFPDTTVTGPFIIRINGEEMLVTNHVGASNNLTVTRGIHLTGGTGVPAHAGDNTSGGTIAPSLVTEVLTTTLTGGLTAAPTTTLAVGISAVATTFDLASVAGFPAVDGDNMTVDFVIRIDNEEMEVLDITGTTLTVNRSVNGTAAAIHGTGATVTQIDAVLDVVDTTSFPATPFNIRIGNEDFGVTAATATQLTVRRGINGTGTSVHSIGDTILRLETTAPIAYDADAATIQAALEALPSFVSGDVFVFDGPTGSTPTFNTATPVVIEFGQNLSSRDLVQLTADTSDLEGDEVQALTLGQTFNGGTFTLTFNSATTAPIPFNADAATVQAALEALSTIGVGNVQVTGGDLPGTAAAIRFTGVLQDQDVSQIAVNSLGLDSFEEQRFNITGTPTGGTFTITVPGFGTTGAIAFNATAAAVQTEFDNTFGVGAATVTGAVALPAGNIFVDFDGALFNDANVGVMTANLGNLTGGTPVFNPVTLTNGNLNASIVTQRAGAAVYGNTHTTQDGLLSVFEALTSLPGTPLSPVTPDIQVTGGDLPGSPITITFAAVNPPQMLIDNSAVVNAGMGVGFGEAIASTVISGVPGDLLPDNFIHSAGSGNGTVGLAFSPLDVNLWHPTVRRGDQANDTVGALDPGHGINAANDNSRTPSDADVDLPGGRTQTQAQGGASLYFGLEAYQGSGTTAYFNYESTRGQLGVLNDEWQRDLTSNVTVGTFDPDVANTYNLPGGAFGATQTNSIDLSSYTADDLPVMYFNYYLDDGSPAGGAAQGQTTMRDSARVFVSSDGGNTWTLVATNNTALDAELPPFLSPDSTLNGSPVQQLFGTSQWRQARIDLRSFAGEDDVRFRFDFSTAGSSGQGLPGDIYGQFSAEVGDDPQQSAERGQNNNNEGFYIDDIIVGLAERGEMVTAALPDQSGFTNLYANARTNVTNLMMPPSIIDTGAYQVEIRRASEFSAPKDKAAPEYVIFQQFDSNDRLIAGQPSAQLPVLETFDSTSDGEEGIPLADFAGDWDKTSDMSSSGGFSLGSAPIATTGVSATQLTFDTGNGTLSFNVMVDTAANPTPVNAATANSFRFFIDGAQQEIVIAGSTLPFMQLPGNGVQPPSFVTLSFPVTEGNHTFRFEYNKGTNAVAGSDRVYIDDLLIPQPNSLAGRVGDRNVQREQGIVVITGNTIRDVFDTGIVFTAAARDAVTNFAYPGSVRNTPVLNNAGLVTSALISNNVVANFGTAGIQFSGEFDTAGNVPAAAVPMGKLINNTIYGGDVRTGTGIVVSNSASPTIFNNIIANTATSITIDASSNALSSKTDITFNLFQNNGSDPNQGTNQVRNATNSAPLFVDAPNDNFYLDPSQNGNPNQAIDSSLDVRVARTLYTGVTQELGIPQQDMFAPSADVYGQTRVADTSPTSTFNQKPIGVGASAFRDRGAIERADFSGPTAGLTLPLDNEDGVDFDSDLTSVAIDNPALLTTFIISLVDPGTFPNAGVGVNDLLSGLVSGGAFTLTQTDINGPRTLQPNIDYTYAYNANTNEAIFTSVTVFPSEALYNIHVDADQIQDIAGNPLQPNQLDGSTQFNIRVTNGVNDEPEVTIPLVPTISENTPSAMTSLTFSADDGRLISVTDPDAFIGTNTLSITLQATNGTVSLPSDFVANNLITITAFTGTAPDYTSVTFEATIPVLNDLFANSQDTLEFSDDFETGSFDIVNWSDFSTSTIDTAALNVPSGTQAARLSGDASGGDSLTSAQFDLSGAIGAELTYSYQRTGGGDSPETSDDLVVEFFNGTGWVELERQLGGGIDMTTFVRRTVSLPSNGLIAGGQVRFRVESTDANQDDWFIDDVSLVSQRTTAGSALTFVPTLNYNSDQSGFLGDATLKVIANDLGQFSIDDPPVPMMNMATIVITVDPVNSPSSVTAASATATVLEDPLVTATDVLVADVADMVTTSVSVTDVSLFPSTPGFYIQVGAEVMRVDSIDTMNNIFTVTRGINGVLDDTALTGDDVSVDENLYFSAANGNAITIADQDDGDNNITGDLTPLQVTLSVANGSLVLGSTTGLITGFGMDANGTEDSDGSDGTLTIRGSIDDINNSLDGLLYVPSLNYNNSNAAPAAPDVLTIDVSDLGNSGSGMPLTDSTTVDITVTARNDAPVNLFGGVAIPDVPASPLLEVLEYSVGAPSFAFDGSTVENMTIASVISVSDVDAGEDTVNPGQVEVTLTATHGTVTLPAGLLGNLTFVGGVGTDDVTMTFTGTITNVNAALAGLVFNLEDGFTTDGAGGSEFATLTINTSDEGRTGSLGSILMDTDVIEIKVLERNDNPVVSTLPPTQVLDEGSSLTFSFANSNEIVIDDEDAFDPAEVQVSLSVSTGTLALGPMGTLNPTFSDMLGVSDYDGSDGTLVIRGSLIELNNALDGLVYTPTSDYNGADSLSISLNDLGNTGNGGPMTGFGVVSITIDATNDPPAVQLGQTMVGATEDSSLVFSAAAGNQIVIADPIDDPMMTGGGDYDVTLVITDPLAVGLTTGIGSLTLNSTATAGLDFTQAGGDMDGSDGTLRFRGTLVEINAALEGLTYTPVSGVNNESRTLTISVDDLGNIDADNMPALQAMPGVVIITIDGSNDPPTVTVPVSDTATTDPTLTTTFEDTGLVFSVATNNAIVVGDIDAGANDVQVELVATNGSVSLDPGFAIPGTFFVFGDAQGTPAGDGTGDTVMRFRGQLGEINDALDGLVFTPGLNFAGTATLAVTINDLGNSGSEMPVVPRSDSGTVTITVIGENDAPTISGPASFSVSEDGSLAISNANANQILIDDVDLGGGKLLVTLSVGDGNLTLNRTTGLTFNVGDGTADTSMTFTGSRSAVNAAIDGLVYVPTAGLNGPDSTGLVITVNDQGNTGAGGPRSTTRAIPINIGAVNDAPTVSVPGAQTTNEDTPIVFSVSSGNSITVADIDAAESASPNEVQVTLGVTNGTLTLGTLAGVDTPFVMDSRGTFDIDGSDGTLVFRGLIADINVALSGLRFIPDANFNGSDTLIVTVDDLGNTGSGVVAPVSRSVNITIDPINDAPVNVVPGMQSVQEDGSLIFSVGNSNLISISDSDAGSNPVQVTLAVGHGTLTLGTTMGLTGAINGNSSTTFTGTIASINNALAGLQYAPNLNFNGADTLTVTTNDLSQTGNGGAQVDTDSVSISVAPVNDPPMAVADTYSVLHGGDLVVNDPLGSDGNPANNGVLLNDMDLDGDVLNAVLETTTTHGVLNFNANGTFTYLHNGMSIGPDSFTYKVNDGTVDGNTVTVTIDVNSPPVVTGGTYSINENSAVGTSTDAPGNEVSKSDANMDIVTLAIVAGNTGNAFAISSAGNITVSDPSALDFETNPTFFLTVEARDNRVPVGVSTTTVTINLNDISENVVLGSADFAGAGSTVRLLLDGSQVRFLNSSGDEIIPSHNVASISSLTLNGQDGVDDTVIVDFADGTPIPASGIVFNGGSASSSDRLELRNGVTFNNVSHTLSGPASGQIAIDGAAIAYTSTEAVDDTLTVVDRNFQFGSGADDVTLTYVGADTSRLTNDASTQDVTFDLPIGILSINLGAGNDVFGTAGTGMNVGLDAGFTGGVIVRGEDGNDSINAGGLVIDVRLEGQIGNDTLVGGLGNDIIRGDHDEDDLDGGLGDDSLYGGAGNDILRDWQGDNRLDGQGSSGDVLDVTVDDDADLTNDELLIMPGTSSLIAIERAILRGDDGENNLNASQWTRGGVEIHGGGGDDFITGTELDDTLVGDEGDDSIRGLHGNDILYGGNENNDAGSGNDSLYGDHDDDQLFGADGEDNLFGGAGRDTLTGGSGNDNVNGGGSVGDIALFELSNTEVIVDDSEVHQTGTAGSDEVDRLRNTERVEFTDLVGRNNNVDGRDFTGRLFVFAGGGDDTLRGGVNADFLAGEAGNDRIDGGAGRDYANGGDGNDIINGRDDIDTLNGGSGRDVILGGNGNDFLLGSAGDDTLLGEAGADSVKGQGSSNDRLTGGGNGNATEVGDVVIGSARELIDDAFAVDWDVLLLNDLSLPEMLNFT